MDTGANIKHRGARCNVRQVQYLLDFMTLHADFGSGLLVGPAGRLKMKELWGKLTAALNQLGPPKPTDMWQRTWSDMKTKARRKCWQVAQANTTADSSKVEIALTQNEQRIISMVGLKSCVGLSVHEDLPQSLEELQNLMDGGSNDPLMDTPPLEYVVLASGELQLSPQLSGAINDPGSLPLSSPPPSPSSCPPSPRLELSPSSSQSKYSPPASPQSPSQMRLSPSSPQPQPLPLPLQPQVSPTPSQPQVSSPTSVTPPPAPQSPPPPQQSPPPPPLRPQSPETPSSWWTDPSRKKKRRNEPTAKVPLHLQLANASNRFAELQQMQADSLQKLSEAMQGFGERVAAAAEAQASASSHMATVLHQLVCSVDRLSERVNTGLDDMQVALGIK